MNNQDSDSTLTPSQTQHQEWIKSYNQTNINNKRLVRNHYGFWMVFRPIQEIDECWRIIRNATEQGSLGPFSSVSTIGNKGGSRRSEVICVFTHCEHDYQDLKRIHRFLKGLGFREVLGYKTYEAKNRPEDYRAQHGGRICKFRWF